MHSARIGTMPSTDDIYIQLCLKNAPDAPANIACGVFVQKVARAELGHTFDPENVVGIVTAAHAVPPVADDAGHMLRVKVRTAKEKKSDEERGVASAQLTTDVPYRDVRLDATRDVAFIPLPRTSTGSLRFEAMPCVEPPPHDPTRLFSIFCEAHRAHSAAWNSSTDTASSANTVPNTTAGHSGALCAFVENGGFALVGLHTAQEHVSGRPVGANTICEWEHVERLVRDDRGVTVRPVKCMTTPPLLAMASEDEKHAEGASEADWCRAMRFTACDFDYEPHVAEIASRPPSTFAELTSGSFQTLLLCSTFLLLRLRVDVYNPVPVEHADESVVASNWCQQWKMSAVFIQPSAGSANVFSPRFLEYCNQFVPETHIARKPLCAKNDMHLLRNLVAFVLSSGCDSPDMKHFYNVKPRYLCLAGFTCEDFESGQLLHRLWKCTDLLKHHAFCWAQRAQKFAAGSSDDSDEPARTVFMDPLRRPVVCWIVPPELFTKAVTWAKTYKGFMRLVVIEGPTA